MVLNVRDLSVSRGGVRILESVTFDVAAGQVVLLRGSNGIGKTTLLRCLAGLQNPTYGSVESDPDSVVYAGHADGIKSSLSVEENLYFWAQIFGQNDISDALVAFDLKGLRNRLAGFLSAGQKRRLGLARLLVADRPVWLLDEPTVSLDRNAVALFENVVNQHLGNGGAAVIATHVEHGLDNSQKLELEPFRAKAESLENLDEAFW